MTQVVTAAVCCSCIVCLGHRAAAAVLLVMVAVAAATGDRVVVIDFRHCNSLTLSAACGGAQSAFITLLKATAILSEGAAVDEAIDSSGKCCGRRATCKSL